MSLCKKNGESKTTKTAPKGHLETTQMEEPVLRRDSEDDSDKDDKMHWDEADRIVQSIHYTNYYFDMLHKRFYDPDKCQPNTAKRGYKTLEEAKDFLLDYQYQHLGDCFTEE